MPRDDDYDDDYDDDDDDDVDDRDDRPRRRRSGGRSRVFVIEGRDAENLLEKLFGGSERKPRRRQISRRDRDRAPTRSRGRFKFFED